MLREHEKDWRSTVLLACQVLVPAAADRAGAHGSRRICRAPRPAIAADYP
jgi:hypothetical protein